MNVVSFSVLCVLFILNVTNAAPVKEVKVHLIDDFDDFVGDLVDPNLSYKQFQEKIGYTEDDIITVDAIVCNLQKTECLIEICKWEETKCLIDTCKQEEEAKAKNCFLMFDNDGKVQRLHGIQSEEETFDVYSNESDQLEDLKMIDNTDKEEEDKENNITNEDNMGAVVKVNDREVQKEGNHDEEMPLTAEVIECEHVNGKEICLIEICQSNKESMKRSCNIIFRRDAIDGKVEKGINQIENWKETIKVNRSEQIETKDVKNTANAEREQDIKYNSLSNQDNMAAGEKENDVKEKEHQEHSLFEGNNDEFNYESITEMCNLINGKTSCVTKVCKWNKEVKAISCNTAEKELPNDTRTHVYPFFYI